MSNKLIKIESYLDEAFVRVEDVLDLLLEVGPLPGGDDGGRGDAVGHLGQVGKKPVQTLQLREAVDQEDGGPGLEVPGPGAGRHPLQALQDQLGAGLATDYVLGWGEQ